MHPLRETSKACFQLKPFDPSPPSSPTPIHTPGSCPLPPPATLQPLKEAEKSGVGRHNYPPLGATLMPLFCALIAPPSDPFLHQHIGTIPQPVCNQTSHPRGCLQHFAGALITLSGGRRGKKPADKGVCRTVLSIQPELKVAAVCLFGGEGGKKHFSTNLVNRAWPGWLQISTELSGP